MFDSSGLVCGGKLKTYLLEKSRVISQERGMLCDSQLCHLTVFLKDERNFHCFYQLAAGADQDMRAELGLDFILSENPFLSDGLSTIRSIDDAREYSYTNDCFTVLGLDQSQIGDLWATLATVLSLGKLQQTIVTRRSTEQASIIDSHGT